MFRAFENPQNAKRVTNFFWYDSRPVKSSEGNRSSHQAAADQLDSLGACAAAPPKRAFGPKTPASQNARSSIKMCHWSAAKMMIFKFIKKRLYQ